jgi:glyoxylase I family protein
MNIHHLAVQVRDLEPAVRWYRELFELPVLREWHDEGGRLRSVWLRLSGGAFLAIERCKGSPETGAAWRDDEPGLHLVALAIDASERGRWEQRLSARGVAVERRSRWTLFFRDLEGNRLGLTHYPEER